VLDHDFEITNIGPAENAMLGAYTTLDLLAGQTRNLTFGGG